MERVLQNTTAQISVTYFTGAELTDPGPVTVTIRDAAGVALVTDAATSGSGAAARAFSLTATHTAALDTLTATWTSATLGTLTTKVEVVGGFLFTTAQLRALVPDATAYPDDKLREARIYAETELERALGYALVPRFATETKVVRASWRLRLRWPHIRTVRSASIGGTLLAQANIDRLLFEPGGWVTGYGRWAGRVEVAYEHGMDPDNEMSAGANRAALNVALEYLGVTVDDIDPRATRLITDDGTIELAASGQGHFTAPVVNRWVNANALPRVA